MTLVDFPPAAPEPSSALAAIRRLSRPLVWIVTALFAVVVVVLAIMFAVMLFYDGPRLLARPGGLQILLMRQPPPIPQGWTTAGALPLIQRLALVISGGMMMGPALAILWSLRRLFRLYAQGIVLEPVNARLLQAIALWLVAYAIAPSLGHLLVAAAGFHDEGWLRMDSLQALLLGLMLLVIARVMQLGSEVHDDASRFV